MGDNQPVNKGTPVGARVKMHIINRLIATWLVRGSPSIPTTRSRQARMPAVFPPRDHDHQK